MTTATPGTSQTFRASSTKASAVLGSSCRAGVVSGSTSTAAKPKTANNAQRNRTKPPPQTKTRLATAYRLQASSGSAECRDLDAVVPVETATDAVFTTADATNATADAAADAAADATNATAD